MEKMISAATKTAEKNKVKVSDLKFLDRKYYEKEKMTVYLFNVKYKNTTLTYIDKD